MHPSVFLVVQNMLKFAVKSPENESASTF